MSIENKKVDEKTLKVQELRNKSIVESNKAAEELIELLSLSFNSLKFEKEADQNEIDFKLLNYFYNAIGLTAKNIDKEVLKNLRLFLNNLNQKSFNINQKVLTALLVLDKYYKTVPEFVFTKNIITDSKEKGQLFNGSVFLPKNREKLLKNTIKTKNYSDLYTLMVLSKYHTEQYKYTVNNTSKICDKTIDRMLNHDLIYIDFIKSLRGKDIKSLISYFTFN